jgi:hypothetical protein
MKYRSHERVAGMKMPDAIVKTLEEDNAIALLATFSEEGVPHTTPLYFVYPKLTTSILTIMDKEHKCYHDALWQKKVMINVMAKGNISANLLCRAGVIRAPSNTHPFMNIVQFDIISIEIENDPLFMVHDCARTKYACPEAADVVRLMRAELKELAVAML